jgi:hypothetical protein
LCRYTVTHAPPIAAQSAEAVASKQDRRRGRKCPAAFLPQAKMGNAIGLFAPNNAQPEN